MHVSDLADVHIKTLKYINKRSKSLILNCGYGKGYSVLDILKIFKKINKKLLINYKSRRSGDVAKVYSNTKKLNDILNWKPKNNNINKIIKSAIKWEASC
jgi:UDP-glucose 4-epimerase